VIAIFSAALMLWAGTGSATKVRSANIGVNLVGPDFITVDGTGSYRLFVTNTGPRKATGVTVFILLPPGVSFVPSPNLLCRGVSSSVRCSLGGLAPAHFKNVRITLTATETAIGRILVTAISRQWDPDSSNNFLVLPLVSQPAPALADVAISIGSYSGPPPAPFRGPYGQVTVANQGPAPALRVLVDYQLPFGTKINEVGMTLTKTCGTELIDDDPWLTYIYQGVIGFCIPRIDPGETKTFIVSLALPDSLGWSAHALAATPDPNTNNNTAQAKTSVG
jgi:uncharacterized repeat protein (TIGR01451 family)